MRYGNRTILGRQWTPCGVRPQGIMHTGYDYGYLYVALNPCNGDLFALLLPTMQSECYQRFLTDFEHHLRCNNVSSVCLISDNAGTHHSQLVKKPVSIDYEYLPAYSPELNPVERLFKELRRATKNIVFESVEHIEDLLTAQLKRYWDAPHTVVSLAYWDWMIHGTS